MSKFIQIHALATYPASNPNRDDTGRPKSVRFGNTERMRISSQSLKRCWRTSTVFNEKLGDSIGTRTRIKSGEFYNELKDGGINKQDAIEATKAVFSRFGKMTKEPTKVDEGSQEKEKFPTEQLVHYSSTEIKEIDDLRDRIISTKELPTEDELNILRKDARMADIAMFGRMFADAPSKGSEAAVQVAHAFTVNPVAIEDDFFTAVDDLNKHEEDAGAAHLGETGYGSGVFYLYICINRDLLKDNLTDENVQKKSLEALLTAALTVCPTGKSNSFAHHNYAQYALIEKGDNTPRSLASAFLNSITSIDLMTEAVDRLEKQRVHFDNAYGLCAESHSEMNVSAGKGNLRELLDFITS